ncbi:MAG: hypothetical protein HY699_07210 [Deltaproteobacteria bacterium]|nr:hypothetical protein [Deltaproteobacteria bacterium]
MDERPQGNGEKSSGLRTQDLATEGWTSRLAVFVTAFLLIESITGLWIYLAPFSAASQFQVLLHTAAGLVVLIPYAYYQVRHFLVWYRQTVTVVMMLGYVLGALVILCSVSGVVLTWEAAFGPKRSPVWDLIHLVTGIVAFVLVAVHLVLAYTRRRAGSTRTPEFAPAVRRFVRWEVAWVGLAAVAVVAVAPFWPAHQIEMPVPQGYGLSKFIEQFDEYRGNPFAPTYARTDNLKLINPDVLAHSESCGSAGCHEQILAEWQPSAHRFSAANPPFQAAQKLFATDREPAETRYCAGCHDPISLFAGAKDIHNLDLAAPGMQEGSSCAVCHSISKVDQRGNADYVLTPPTKYLWESTKGWKKAVSDFLIRAYPHQHLADYDRNLMRTPEFCGACHKQFIPEALNRFGLAPSQNQFDEWRKSSWHVETDAQKDLACRDCHMRLVHNSGDPGRGEAGDQRRAAADGAHRHHGMIGTNMFMPAVMKLPNWEKQVQLTREWIEGKTVIPEIAHVWPEGPVGSIELLGPEQIKTGEEVVLRAIVMNRKAGHNLITGPLDFMRVWVHLRVFDGVGNVLAEWGAIDPATRWITDEPGKLHEIGNPRDQGTMVLEGLPMNREGVPLLKHELWMSAGGKGARVIFPRYSDNQVYKFRVPAGTAGPITVKADLNFRRYRQQFLDLVVPTMEKDSGVYQFTVPQDSTEKRIALIDGTPMAMLEPR